MSPTTTAATQRMPEWSATPEFATAVRAAAEASSRSVAEFTRTAVARYCAVTEPSPYSFDGRGHSLLRDSFVFAGLTGAGRTATDEAEHRLTKFKLQQADPDRTLDFVLNTGNASQVVPPGYHPDPFVGVPIKDRPLVTAATRLPLTDGSPFNVPGRTTYTGASADHVEGTNPTEGTLSVGMETVSPTGVSGLYKCTREIFDSSNPAIDAIALAAMRESYGDQTEAKVYTELNGSEGQGGIITSGRVPSGAQARTATGTAADLRLKMRQSFADFAFVRGVKARHSLLSAEAAGLLADVLDAATSDDTCLFREQGVRINPAPAMTGNAAGDADVLTLGPDSLWAWESPTLALRYAERSGPAHVELALFGYFATKLLNATGLSSIRYN